MALLYAPPASHGHFYYETAQLAAFLTYVGLLLAQGYRRGYPWRQWLPLVAAATLALMLGCQLAFLPPSEWLAWLRGDATVAHALAVGPRSVVGGAAASLLVVLALRRALGLRGGAVLDAFAGPLCWALAVQCVGCGLAGCCWGEVAVPGSLGFSYGPGTLPYLAQQAQGLLPAGASHALPVVPTQLYHLLLCGGVGWVLQVLRRRAAGWPDGSRYLLAMCLLCLGRFGIEFWRDPAGEPLLGTALVVAGFSFLKIQALLLLAGLALLSDWAWLVRRGRVPALAQPAATGYPAWVALGLLLATGWLGGSLLTAPEVLTLKALLLLVLLAEAHAWLPRLGWALPRLAGLPLSLVLGSTLLLATAQAPAPQRAIPGAPTKSTTLTLGTLGNVHDAEENILDDHSGCSGSTPMRLHQQVRAAGAEVAVTTISDTYGGPLTDANAGAAVSTTVGGGVWIGRQQVDALILPDAHGSYPSHPDTTLHYTLFDFHLYRQRTSGSGWLTIGYRLGLHFGDLGYYSYFDGGNTADALHFMPELMFSLGNPRLLYGQADLGYGAENALGACTSRLALGSGLGQLHGSQVLAGYAHAAHSPTQDMAFVSANLRLPGGTGFSALSLEPYFATDFGQHNTYSLKLHYQLGK